MEKKLTINPELRDLLPPLSPAQFEKLEAEIIKDGCTNPLVLWNDVIVDGHNRYEICTRCDIRYKTVQKEFVSLDEAKLWMWANQDGRRNLTRFGRVEFALKIKDIIAAQSRERQGKRNDLKNNFEQNSARSKRTRQQLAEFANVSHDTVDRVEYILLHAEKETINTLRWDSKGISINKVFNDLKAKLRETKPSTTSTPSKTASKKAKSSTTSKPPSANAAPTKELPASAQSTFFETGAGDNSGGKQSAERPTAIAPIWKNVKEHQTYCCGIRFEPDPDDDFFDWITREEREDMRKMQEECPAIKLVPLIRNYTIQNIPEHDARYLVSCLFSWFQPLYHEKLLLALAQEMLGKGRAEAVRKVFDTLKEQFPSL